MIGSLPMKEIVNRSLEKWRNKHKAKIPTADREAKFSDAEIKKKLKKTGHVPPSSFETLNTIENLLMSSQGTRKNTPVIPEVD